MIDIVPASPAHIGTIATRMRDIDKLECAVFGRSPKQALRAALMGSVLAWTAKVDGRAEAMFGVTPVSTLEGRGSPWLLMTPEAARHGKALVAMGRSYSVGMAKLFPVLENWVHADNVQAIAWLSRLGYTVGDLVTINGQPMRHFSRVAGGQRGGGVRAH